MELTRRSFLGGAVAVATVAAVAPVFPVSPLPILYGDGKHDDTLALQALLDKQPVIDGTSSEVIVVGEHGHVFIQGGVYLVSDTLHIRAENIYLIEGLVLCNHDKDWMLEVHPTALYCRITQCIFKSFSEHLQPKNGLFIHDRPDQPELDNGVNLWVET